ncbi:hypothetical protein NEOLEDRAFT_1183174 [Neolentinus lepideus HHB14362 ss-1]|uniref:Uncharacterized protein n=1 Tax=Neolentinus lepideus HHB14362 ss-1 TaxID=1314782 RepID=A0A165NIX8_9AGAM|nr:hypothetical protein NEOLEDRAFT_1183174 [Neolentinus lepideus HHB14362 ss-1]
MSDSGSNTPTSDYTPSDEDSDKENNENFNDQENVNYDSDDEREPPRKHYAQLDPAKINRLLRPLKAKCTHLANFSEAVVPSTGSNGLRMVTTYSHRHRLHRPHGNRTQPLEPDSSIPPLATLAEPEMIRPVRLQRIGDMGTMELSRRIYAIRDSFKNILDNVYQKDVYREAGYYARVSGTTICEGRTRKVLPRFRRRGYEPKERIHSLRDLCSVVAGRHMRLEKPGSDDENGLEERDVEETVGIDEETEVIDELYDSIFPPYRQRTVVSHALTHILETEKVNRNQTLLNSLLLLVLEYDHTLIPESHAIVQRMFSVALSRGSNKKLRPPVCHDLHASWLNDLHRLCTVQHPQPQVGILMPTTPTRKPKSLILTPTLVGLMLDTLHRGSVEDALEVWMSKAMTRFLDNMRQNDLPEYFLLLTGMADAIARGALAKDTLEALEDEAALADVQAMFCDILRSLLHWICPSSTSTETSEPTSPKKPRRRFWFGAADALSSPSQPELIPVPEADFKRPVAPEDVQEIVDFLIHIAPCGLHASNTGKTAELVTCLLAVCVAGAPASGASVPSSDKAKLQAMLKDAPPTSTVFEYLTDGILHCTLLILPSPRNHIVNSSWETFSGFAECLRDSNLLRLEASWWVCALKSFEHVHEGRIGWASTLFTSRKECDKWERCRGWLMEEVERSERAAYNRADWEWEEMIGCWVKKTSAKKRGRVDNSEEGVSDKNQERVKRRRVVTPEPEEDDFSSVLSPNEMAHFCLPRSMSSSPDPISSFMTPGVLSELAENPLGSSGLRWDRNDDYENEDWVRQATDPDSVADTFSSDDALDLFAYESSSP